MSLLSGLNLRKMSGLCRGTHGTVRNKGRTIRKVMGGRGIFENFFRYQIPYMNFF